MLWDLQGSPFTQIEHSLVTTSLTKANSASHKNSIKGTRRSVCLQCFFGVGTVSSNSKSNKGKYKQLKQVVDYCQRPGIGHGALPAASEGKLMSAAITEMCVFGQLHASHLGSWV